MPSYEKNKSSGLWSCRFRESDELGVTHQKRLSGYKTKKEAQYAYEDYLKSEDERKAQAKAKAEAEQSLPGEMLFDTLLTEYLAWTQNRVKESSFVDIQSKINNGLAPHFRGAKMREITPKRVSDWINGIDYSYASKKWLISTLASIYKYGNKYYDISDIMPKVDRPRNLEMPHEMEIWTPEEFKRFISAVTNPILSAYYKTLYLTGCRRGEGAALTWSDLDVTQNTLRINKSVTNKTGNGAYAITTPKNKGSVRTVTIPQPLTEELLKLRTEETEETDFIFGGERPPATSSIDYVFKQAIKKSEVNPIRLHDLRHSCASLLISKGVSIVAVSRRLGHTNIEQTLNTYSHLMPDDQAKIISVLNTLPCA